jgi:hypothetical protein
VQVFVDESGTARQSRYLAAGALSFRRGHGLVSNKLALLRDRANWRAEAQFVNVNRTTLHLYRNAVTVLAASDAKFTCLVLDTDEHDPFASRREAWKSHAQLVMSLVNHVVGAERIASVVIDHIAPPGDVNYEGYIAGAVNRTVGRLAIAGVCRMDSRACWGPPADGHPDGRYRAPAPPADGLVGEARQPEGQARGSHCRGVQPRDAGLGAFRALTVIEGEPVTRPNRRLKVVRQVDAEVG